MNRRKIENKSVPIGVSIPKNLIPDIDELARAEGRSRSGLISFLLLKVLDEYRTIEKPSPNLKNRKRL